MKNSKKTGLLRKTWTYFKKGKTEIAFVLSIYNTVLIWWKLGDLNLFFKNINTFIMLFTPIYFVISIIMGKYITINVDTTIPFVNPFTQDSIVAGVLSSEALIDWFDGDKELAISKIKQSIAIRERWMNEWSK